MIDPIVVTSHFGERKGFLEKHKGVDLRSVFYEEKAEIRLPESARFLHKTKQEKWGITCVFNTHETDNLIKFTHISPVSLIEGMDYAKGTLIGYTTITEYMILKELGEHLHFEVWPFNKKGKRVPINPLIYFEYLGLTWHDKEEYNKEY